MTETSRSIDIIQTADRWLNEGRKVALATVVKTWGSSPRGVGAHLIVDDAGNFMGSVSGGCIEGSVISESEVVLSTGKPKLLEYGVSQERAWEVGLSCGGSIHIHLQALSGTPTWDALNRAIETKEPVVLVSHINSNKMLLFDAEGRSVGDLSVTTELRELAQKVLKADRAQSLLTEDGEEFLLRPYNPSLRLLVVGGVHIAQTLLPMAELAGFSTTLIDPRKAFATTERFPGTILVHQWPDDAIKDLAPDKGTAIVTLTHDPKLDDPALINALKSNAFYIGALGSRRTHEKRRTRLSKHFDEADLDRIHGPVGLNLGGRAPQHIAVSIIAQMVEQKFKG